MKRLTSAGLVTAAALVAAGPSRAQTDQPSVDIEIPTIVLDTGANNQPTTEDTQLDLANVVQSAAKGVTTVQEAPVIVTVITNDEIADRQYESLEEAFDTVPGWMRTNFVHQFHMPLVRGQAQAVQFLHDGLSLFDPYVNIASTSRAQPLETIKRIEMITGPGGVLWGSNSLVGILNIITKDADDVDGVEVGGRVGDGNGDRANARAYVMYGNGDIAHGKAKLFLHGSFDTYKGPGYEMPSHMFSQPLPQPNGLIIEGPVTQADPPQSYLINLDGKLTLGKLQLRVQAPFGERHLPLGFPGNVVREHLGEDTQRGPDGQLLCPQDPTFNGSDQCVDRGRRARDELFNYWDRYAVAEYRSRLAHGKAGISVKAYGIQFVRAMPHTAVLEPIPSLLEGGLGVDTDLTDYRIGAAVEGDVELTNKARLLYGAEGFNEFSINNVTTARQGDGIQASFIGPEQLERLPVPCPRHLDTATGMISFVPGCPLTGSFPASRTVLSGYLDPQWRPSKKLILDVGGRVSYSPKALGLQGYDPTITTSGTAVYSFLPGWHVKLNFAQGFRPPVFNNLVSNGEGVQLDGREDLKVETSQAEQVEVNARIFKGERRIRELNFRADYSYTTINNYIQLVGGRYENSADRGISSAEFLGKLYVQGGHRIELGYTWLRIDTQDRGQLRAIPENWFNLSGVFNLVDGRLTMTSNLRVAGVMEDPNRFAEIRNSGYDAFDRVVSTETGMPINNSVNPSELVLDRLPPSADIEVGLTWTPTRSTHIRATIFNALNGRYYHPDPFGDYQPRLEFQPNPMEDFRAYLSASYQY
jgi:outer membrane receptor protein involved in Fe transport